MKNYTGIIETKVHEVEDRLHSCKDNRIYIIEYGHEISRVDEVSRDTGHVYRSLCCKTEGNINDDADRMWIRKKLMGVRGIRSKSL